jgi:hypothetical protein
MCRWQIVWVGGMLAIVTLRQDAPTDATAALGQGIEAIYEWSFRIGPGFFVGVGNGLILGYMMFKSGLVPGGWPCSDSSAARSLPGGDPRHLRRDRGQRPDPGVS